VRAADKLLDRLFAAAEDRRLWLRAALAAATVVIGIMFVGIGYPHLCEAGSRWIEGVGAAGIPMAAGAAVCFFRRYRVGLLVAVCLLTFDFVAREPYLRWVHGPHSPWPGIRGTRSGGGPGATAEPSSQSRRASGETTHTDPA